MVPIRPGREGSGLTGWKHFAPAPPQADNQEPSTSCVTGTGTSASRNAGWVETTCPDCGEELVSFDGRLARPHCCAHCGGCLPWRRRSDRRYCAAACRQGAYRLRRKRRQETG